MRNSPKAPWRAGFLTGLAGLVAGLLLAATATDGLAQRKSSPLRSRPSKDDLMRKAEELKEAIPQLKEAAMNEGDESREEAGRRALKLASEALGSDLQQELDAEAKRLSDGVQTPASEKLAAARRIAEKARDGAPDDVRKLLEDVPTALPADESDGGEADASGNFDGILVRTTDGKTLKVPGIQVAAQFTGEVVPIEGNGPPPGPKPAPKAKRLTKAQQKAASRKVQIESEGGAVFSATGLVGDAVGDKKPGPPIVIFEKEVVVRSGDILILCDKLIVYMKESEAEPGKDGVKNAEKNAGKDAGGVPGVGGIERAVATGREVIVQKTLPDGTKKLGKARHVTYVDATKDVILKDWPQVQEGPNLQKATSADTIMTIGESGKMTAVGPTSSEFVPEADLEPTAKRASP